METKQNSDLSILLHEINFLNGFFIWKKIMQSLIFQQELFQKDFKNQFKKFADPYKIIIT